MTALFISISDSPKV